MKFISDLFRVQLRLYFAIPVFFLTAASAVMLSNSKGLHKENLPPSVPGCDCTSESIRKEGFLFTQPILMGERHTESPYLQGMKTRMESYLDEVRASHRAENVSVYFRRMKDGAFFTINPDQLYNPASMSKVIFLITYLKEAEDQPEIMDKKIFFATHFNNLNTPTIVSVQLKENSWYTVRQLLEYMIRYSDNDAAILLSHEMNMNTYAQLFRDLKIKQPADKGEFFISVTEFSRFFRLLYNSTYFKPELSEFGLKLLTTSDYRNGLYKGIDPEITVAHKFGERTIGNISELHEFGIVYINRDPYLIGVMSSGNNLQGLSDIMGEISKIAFQEYKAFIHV